MTIERRVVVTGASGFVGCELMKEFHGLGLNTLAVSRRPLSGVASRVARVSEVDSTTDWSEILERDDTVVHLAGRAHVMREPAHVAEKENFRVNYEGTVRLAEQALQAGVKRVVFVSSAKVFGEESRVHEPFRSNDTPMPSGPYATSKYQAEFSLQSMMKGSGTELVIVRPPLVYGPRARGNFRRLVQLASKPIPLPLGHVENRRSMIYVGNLASFLAAASVHPGGVDAVLLPTDGRDVTVGELVSQMRRAMAMPPRIVGLPLPLGRVGSNLARWPVLQRLLGNFQLDASESREALGWAPPYSFANAIAKTVAPMRA